ncbi:MAG: hypothetical protein RLY93_06015 [Sumerlaeia bacterium]
MKALLELTYTPRSEWSDKARDAFSKDLRERYPRVSDLTDKKNDEKRFQLRVNGDAKPGAVPYAAEWTILGAESAAAFGEWAGALEGNCFVDGMELSLADGTTKAPLELLIPGYDAWLMRPQILLTERGVDQGVSHGQTLA